MRAAFARSRVVEPRVRRDLAERLGRPLVLEEAVVRRRQRVVRHPQVLDALLVLVRVRADLRLLLRIDPAVLQAIEDVLAAVVADEQLVELDRLVELADLLVTEGRVDRGRRARPCATGAASSASSYISPALRQRSSFGRARAARPSPARRPCWRPRRPRSAGRGPSDRRASPRPSAGRSSRTSSSSRPRRARASARRSSAGCSSR